MRNSYTQTPIYHCVVRAANKTVVSWEQRGDGNLRTKNKVLGTKMVENKATTTKIWVQVSRSIVRVHESIYDFHKYFTRLKYSYTSKFEYEFISCSCKNWLKTSHMYYQKAAHDFIICPTCNSQDTGKMIMCISVFLVSWNINHVSLWLSK